MSTSAALPTAEQLMDGIARALKARDFEAAVALLMYWRRWTRLRPKQSAR